MTRQEWNDKRNELQARATATANRYYGFCDDDELAEERLVHAMERADRELKDHLRTKPD